MYGVWTPEQVATAEEPVLARTPEGALMRRAAYGAAQVALRMLARADRRASRGATSSSSSARATTAATGCGRASSCAAAASASPRCC